MGLSQGMVRWLGSWSIPLSAIILLFANLSTACDPSCTSCPCFPDPIPAITLPDNIQIGSSVVTLTASFSADTSTTPITPTYSLTAASATTDFAVDASTGAVTTTTTLDHTTMAAYSLAIQATNGSSTAYTHLNITLVDTDTTMDDSLVCVLESINGRVLEGALNSQTPLPTCFNGDGSVALGSELTFTITGDGDSLFEVGLSGGTISNTAALDYETRTVHTLTVTVTNSDPVPRTSVLLVTITVDPENESPPVFPADLVVIPVSEAVSVGATIGRLEASDSDGGLDGIIVYSYSQQTPSPSSSSSTSSSSIVYIHPSTGSIVLTDTLDFESTQVHNVTVTATDSSAEPSSRMSASAMLSIVVLDANDIPPAFSRALYSVELREDSDSGHELVTLVCDARDNTAGLSAVTYAITRGNEDGTFNMDAGTGLVTLQGGGGGGGGATLDFDVGPRIYSLGVECRETQPPHMLAESLVLIQVTSFNEFFPDPGNEYVVNVREDTPPGTQVLQVQGRDRDYGPAGVLRYFIDNTNANNPMGSPTCPDNLFMDVNMGTLYLMSEFDHEVGGSSFHCILSVWDSERPIHISEQDIFVTVVDVNDALPACVPASVRSVEVAEDTPTGRPFLTLSCSDPDSATLQYSLLDSTLATRFSLSPQGGELSLLEEGAGLDFETQSLFVVSVSVSDGEHAVNTTVYVTVTGVNEHAPVFTTTATTTTTTTAGDDQPSCSVLENSPQGTLVCTVLALDSDRGVDGVIRYGFSTPSSLFEIDADSGEIFIVTATAVGGGVGVDREETSSHMLVVVATDGGTPALSSRVNVTVSVGDRNDNAPQMAAHVLAGDVAENSPIGTLVATLTCTDADEANTPNSDLALEITDVTQLLADGTEVAVTTPLFAVASPTGELTTLQELDFEQQQSSYRLSVTCRDHGLPALATPSTVRVNVAPVNEYAPTFARARYEVTVPETTEVGGASIGNLSATDGDAGEQGNVVYSISSSDPSSATPFWMDPQTGMLYVVEQLRCEVETRYSLTVLASDGGVPPLQGSVEVVVSVDPCVFGELVPTSSVYVADVMENSPVGTLVASVRCSSSRALPFLVPSYMLTPGEGGGGGEGGVFEIDANTGDITVLSQPDYEQATSHLLYVRCFDSNSPDTHHTDVVVYLPVLPTNEHTPTFPEDPYVFSVSESAALGSVVAQVHAVDGDAGMDGEVTYSIQDSGDEVFIDGRTGEVYLASSLDREASDTLTITVTATDESPFSVLSSQKEVRVHVLDSNDNWPVCDRTVYHVHASPQTRPPAVVFSELNCTDADLGGSPNSDLTYSLGGPSEKFSVDSATGVLSLVAALDPEDAVTYRVPVVVRDSGATPLSVTLLLIIDLQEPPLDLPNNSISDHEYISLVEAEGRKNSVVITLTDFSRPIWEESTVAMDTFHTAVARSVTSHCAIFPEACSLIAGCAQFFGSTFSPDRRKRSIDETSNYANFIMPHVVVLPNTTELRPDTATTATTNTNTVSLNIQFYVKLPHSVNRSPNRATNYVVPKATLDYIVEQDSSVIGDVVRSSVSPSLTDQLISGWRVVATVCLVVISVAVTAAIMVGVAYAAYKYRQRSQNRVVAIKTSTKAQKPSPKAAQPHLTTQRPHPTTQRPHPTTSTAQGPQTSLHRQADQTFPNTPTARVSMAHLFTVNSRTSPSATAAAAAQQQSPNRVSVGSGNTTISSSSRSERSSNASMENQVSREGSVSPRRISSEGSRSLGDGGLDLQDCCGGGGGGDDEDMDPLGNFPYTRPENPVRTNGLSIWTWR